MSAVAERADHEATNRFDQLVCFKRAEFWHRTGSTMKYRPVSSIYWCFRNQVLVAAA